MFGGFFGRVRLRVVGGRRHTDAHTDAHPDGHHVAFTDRTINHVMSLEVVEIRATVAVVRIEPAG